MKRSPISLSGFISLNLVRYILPIGFFIGGGQALYTALTNREPYSVTYADYVQKHPDHKWVELKETRLDVLSSITSGPLGTVTQAYVPLHAPGEPDDAKVAALLHTRDPKLIDLVKQLKALPDEKAVVEFVMKNRESVFPQQTIRGLVQSGLDSDSKKRRKIAKLDANLTDDFAVIEDGKKPDMMMGIILLVAGFPAAYFCWFWRSKTPEGIPTTPSGTPPPMPQ
jgi:hypothetical protein